MGLHLCGPIFLKNYFKKGLLKIGQRLYSSIDRIG